MSVAVVAVVVTGFQKQAPRTAEATDRRRSFCFCLEAQKRGGRWIFLFHSSRTVDLPDMDHVMSLILQIQESGGRACPSHSSGTVDLPDMDRVFDSR